MDIELIDVQKEELPGLQEKGPQFGFCISVTNKSSKFFFSESEKTRDEWFRALKNHMVVIRDMKNYENLKMVYNCEPLFSVTILRVILRGVWCFLID